MSGRVLVSYDSPSEKTRGIARGIHEMYLSLGHGEDHRR